ncbi:unnamed protein product [Rotaria sp. Silwood2]|nr:unnamed protein product [Rotaria sp. Silwood2]
MSSIDQEAAEFASRSSSDLLTTETSIFSSNETACLTQDNNQTESTDNTISLKSWQSHTSKEFAVIWLDPNINELDNKCYDLIIQVRRIINSIQLFTDVDQCIDFIANMEDGRFLFILSYNTGITVVPLINDLAQVDSIYIYNNEEIKSEQRLLEYSKIQGIFSDILMIFDQLQQEFLLYEQNLISMNIISLDSTLDLNQLVQSFIYSVLLTDILCEMNYDEKAKINFFKFYRDQCLDFQVDLDRVDEMEKSYSHHSPIWWYIKMPSIYLILAKALRTQDVTSIIKIGFYLKDLNKNIEQVYSMINKIEKLVVYRGQIMSNNEFEKIKKSKGSLLLFNNFLSTTIDREVALKFTNNVRDDSHLAKILFDIEIDPSVSKNSFALLKFVNQCSVCENEILFPMHTIFHVSEVKEIDNGLWNVTMIMTNDINSGFERLKKRIHEEIEDSNELHRLGNLLIKMGQVDKAEEIYKTLFEILPNDYLKELVYIHNQFGNILIEKNYLEKALSFLENTFDIRCKSSSSNDPDLSVTYINIGFVYNKMGQDLKALSFYKKALEIQQSTLPSNHPDLAITYNSIGLIYNNMGEYLKALSCYEDTLKIQQKFLPINHLSLADTYTNIGLMHSSMHNYLKAISYYKKALQIQKAILPFNDLSLATTYNNIGRAHAAKENYSFARNNYDDALKIQENALPSNDPLLAEAYNNVGEMYRLTGNYITALQYYKKALKIQEEQLPPNHLSLAKTKSNIDQIYNSMKNYEKVFSDLVKMLKIQSKLLPSNHPTFDMSSEDIATILEGLHRYKEAIKHKLQTFNIMFCSIESNQSQADKPEQNPSEPSTIIIDEKLNEKTVNEKWIYPVLLVLPSLEQSQLYSILQDITDDCIIPTIQIDKCIDKLKSNQQIKDFIFDVSSVSVDDRNRILDAVSSLNNITSIYLLGKSPETKKERNEFFKQFDKVCIFCEDHEQLAVQWALDTASHCRICGNQCAKADDKNAAREHFQRDFMATSSTQVLTLFDPEDKHECYDTLFSNRIFIRFIDSHHCCNHICTHVVNQAMDIHFFFPDTELNLIMHWPPEHNDTHKYIYCRDQASINQIRTDHGRCVANKIFSVDDLEFEIRHVQITLLYSLAKQKPEESRERDEVASKTINELECLRHMLKQMMTDQMGEQPIEHQ